MNGCCAQAGKIGGPIRVCLDFLVLFASRQKERKAKHKTLFDPAFFIVTNLKEVDTKPKLILQYCRLSFCLSMHYYKIIIFLISKSFETISKRLKREGAIHWDKIACRMIPQNVLHIGMYIGCKNLLFGIKAAIIALLSAIYAGYGFINFHSSNPAFLKIINQPLTGHDYHNKLNQVLL